MKQLTLAATLENIEAVTDFVNRQLESRECPAKAAMQIAIAVDELFSNIARYAYAPETGEATVRVEFLSNPTAVKITFIDAGKQYNPLEKEEPDTTLSAEQRQIGGLGIYMVKKSMDAVEYKYVNGQNTLSVTKILGGEKNK